MKKFGVLLRGENFFLREDGTTKRFGFYATRFVDAVDNGDAEQLAVELTRQDVKLRSNVLNDSSDPPMLFADEIEEMESFDVVESLTPGLVFFVEEETEH